MGSRKSKNLPLEDNAWGPWKQSFPVLLMAAVHSVYENINYRNVIISSNIIKIFYQTSTLLLIIC